MSPRVAVCFLVINKMDVLPQLAITSAFDRTNAEILIGFLDDSDLPILRKDVHIHKLQLENPQDLGLRRLGSGYSDFSEDNFYKIVQLKWQLLEKALELGFDYIIYSDTDVYWNLNPISEIVQVFNARKQISIQIQSFTDLPSQPKLCMGFVALRNSVISKNFLTECRLRHTIYSETKGRIGDDDIVTQYYVEKGFPNFIQELPQTTFPVGRMLKLYSTKSIFPGLPSPEPFVFHANYVVGLRNKIILMKLFMKYYSRFDSRINMGANFYCILQIQRLRLKLSWLKRYLIKKSPS